jgi:hypothetical protein
MEIKDFIGKVVISARTKERYILTKVASPYIEVKTEKLNEYGGRSCYRFETINGDPFTRGVLVFEDASLMLPFQKRMKRIHIQKMRAGKNMVIG